MTRHTFRWTVEGFGAGNPFKAEGKFEMDQGLPPPALFDRVMRASFMQITSGKAVFGKPGVGCHGPYEITRWLIERLL